MNLPATTPAAYTLLTGDVKKAFENIPLDGDDGLDCAVTAYLHEGYDWADKALFVPLTVDHTVCGKARFAVRQPPPFGTVHRWIEVPVDLAVLLAVEYSRLTVIQTGQFLVLQVLGVPMGGPP